jgi:hypothetical protein
MFKALFKKTDYLTSIDPNPVRPPQANIEVKVLPPLPKEVKPKALSSIVSLCKESGVVEFALKAFTEKDVKRQAAKATLTIYDLAEIEATKRLNVEKAKALKPLFAKGLGYVTGAKEINREGFGEDTCKGYWGAFGRALKRENDERSL